MFRCFGGIRRIVVRLWNGAYGFLSDYADRQVAAWAASLQTRRRYTHPDEAKRYRQNR
jgi:hypothetical protein